jgi:hypothetical protein
MTIRAPAYRAPHLREVIPALGPATSPMRKLRGLRQHLDGIEDMIRIVPDDYVAIEKGSRHRRR